MVEVGAGGCKLWHVVRSTACHARVAHTRDAWQALASSGSTATRALGLAGPVSVHGRVSDIWRSYISQAIFHLLGLHVALAPPWVRHDRSAHDLRKDFEAEGPLRDTSAPLLDYLKEWITHNLHFAGECCSCLSAATLFEDLYIKLYERCIIDALDVRSVQKWIMALGHRSPFLWKDLCSIEDGMPVISSPEPPTAVAAQAFVHINHGHWNAVSIWKAVYGLQYISSHFFVLQRPDFMCKGSWPALTTCLHSSLRPARGGWFAQQTVALANQVTQYHVNVWAHDDFMVSIEYLHCGHGSSMLRNPMSAW